MEYLDLIKQIKTLEDRNNQFLHLTANENQMSQSANKLLSYKISERYYFGGGQDGIIDGNPFMVLGMEEMEELVVAAQEASKEMLSASLVNLRCLSGVHAMMCAILSTTEPGDLVMTVSHEDGGHFATTGILARVGRKHSYIPYNKERGEFDIDAIVESFIKDQARAIYFDVSYYIDPIDISVLRKRLGDKAIIIYDASHTMGLMMGQEFQSPLKEGADVVCANTHKTLPGPQKGMVAFRDLDFGMKANAIIDSSFVSSSHTHHVAALALTILEMKEFGKEYAKQIVANSNALGGFLEQQGYEIRRTRDGMYSHNHQVHVFIDKKGDRLALYKRLFLNNVSTNFENVLGGRLFIRLGTQEVTRRGMREQEMLEIASVLNGAMDGDNVVEAVVKLNTQFSNIKYSFDGLI